MFQPDVEIRAYRPGDEQRILDTFNLVFRQANGSAFVDRTIDQWRWQYLNNPAGHRIMVAVAHDGTVAAHFAGLPMRADTPFGPQRFVHCVDSMTHPTFRQLQPMALFARIGRHFREQCEQVGEALCWGYPVEVAFRIGQQFLDYQPLLTIDYLVRAIDQAPTPLPAGWQVERLQTLPADLDALWARVRADKQCLVRRDRRYLDWRYRDHPDAANYELRAARHGDRLAGLLVLRTASELVPDGMAIVDWLVPEAEPLAAAALLAAATRRQHEAGRRRLFTVLPPWSLEARLLAGSGFAAVPSATWMPRRLVFEIHLALLTPEFLRTGWWYTLGDSDLV
jgi:hypothetical protein